VIEKMKSFNPLMGLWKKVTGCRAPVALRAEGKGCTGQGCSHCCSSCNRAGHHGEYWGLCVSHFGVVACENLEGDATNSDITAWQWLATASFHLYGCR